MISYFLIAIIVVLLGYIIYKEGNKNEDYFLSKNITYEKPVFAIGTGKDLLFKKVSMTDHIRNKYNNFPNEKVVGHFNMRTPFLIIHDPAILKQLTVKEFHHFTDHRLIINEKADPMLGNSLISLTGQKWKDMRATLSPTFTTSKMRIMFQLVLDSAEQMTEYFQKEAKENGPQTYEMKDIFSRITNDIISSCAFGLKVDSLEHKMNDFYVTTKKMVIFTTTFKILKIIAIRLFPSLMMALKVHLNTKREINFLRSIILGTMRIRERDNIFRPDMINLLMEARKGVLSDTSGELKDFEGFATVEESNIGKSSTKRDWSDDEIVAQCYLFLLAGFDTSSSTMSFTTYELAVNPNIQQKLFEEIRDTNELLNNDKLTYDVLQKMKYMDMVISESLRKWPPAPLTDRMCTSDFDFDDGNGFRFQFRKGFTFWIPIVGLHHDPKYFPNPNEFNPERFNDENKHNINLSTYLPFGIGPRNCIGSRFALMEVKAILYYLLLNFSIEVVEKTQIPLKLAPKFAGVETEKGIWLEFRPRT